MRWAKGDAANTWECWDRDGKKVGDIVGEGTAWRWALGLGGEERPLFGGEREDLDAAKTAVEMYARLFGPILGAAWVASVGGVLELAFEGAVLARVERAGWYVKWRAIESGGGGTCRDLEEACRLAAKEAALHRCKQMRCG